MEAGSSARGELAPSAAEQGAPRAESADGDVLHQPASALTQAVETHGIMSASEPPADCRDSVGEEPTVDVVPASSPDVLECEQAPLEASGWV